MKESIEMKMKLRALGGVPVALMAVVAAIMLAGCAETVKTPTSFATDDLTVVVPTFTVDMPIAGVTLPEVDGSSSSYSYSLSPDVPGLMLDKTTRVLSGTPTTAGTYNVTYTAESTSGSTTSLKLTISVLGSFHGTWQSTRDWGDNNEIMGTFVDTLTFTTERYILHRSHNRPDGTYVDDWSNSGTWESSGSTITRIQDDDDDVATPDGRWSKHYLWGDEDRTILCMQDWEWQHEEIFTGCMPYDRVLDPIPSPVGVWRGTQQWDIGTVTFIMTVNADGTLTAELQEPPHRTCTVAAMWTHDAANYYLELTEATRTCTPTGGSPEPDDGVVGADRIAYAPTDRSPDEIIVSYYWEETQASDSYRQYGGYYRKFQRQQ
jgi:hypothetical protein